MGIATEVPIGSISAVPASEPVDVPPSDGTVICVVGPATPVTLGSASCTKGHHAITCVSTGYCGTPEDNPPAPPTSSSDGPYASVLCVDTGSGSFAPFPPSAEGSAIPPVKSGCPDLCAGTAAVPSSTSSSGTAYTINTKVAPGESGTFDGPAIPAGEVLVVDVATFRNPAADTGTITLEGDAAHRMTENLGDLRTHDFHFDARKLTFDADHPLRVTVDCANAADVCTPSLVVTGHLATVQH